jgi:integrase
MSREQVRQFFSVIENRLDRALFLLMLRGGLRVSEVVRLKVGDIDWEQKSLLVEQGKGRKDRWVYLSVDALAGLHECLRNRPLVAPGDYFFWNQKRKKNALTVKAVQKKMERYTKAAGIKASCHSLRHTFALTYSKRGRRSSRSASYLVTPRWRRASATRGCRTGVSRRNTCRRSGK